MASNALGPAALICSALLAAAASAQSKLPPDWYLDARTAPVAQGVPVPDLGERSGDHMLPSAEAAQRCAEAAQSNLVDLGKYHEGVLELAPPDEYLVCLVKRAKGLSNFSDLPRRRFNPFEVQAFRFEDLLERQKAKGVKTTAGDEATLKQDIVYFLRPKVPVSAMPLGA